jgi:hypothetical protein
MYTTDETGVMNAYATEVPTYLAQYPTPEEQRRYLVQGAVATLLVALTVLTAVVVS